MRLAPELTRDLKDLVRLASDEDAFADLLRRGLEWLARLTPYDLATVFLLQDGQLVVKAARGPLADERVRGHRLELGRFPTLREALETRRARAYTEEDHAHGDGDPFDGVLDLPDGHACMVVPLCAGPRCFGVLTLDRDLCHPYPDEVVHLVEVFGQVLAMALYHAELAGALEVELAREHERADLLDERIGGAAVGLVDESAAPAMREVVRKARQVAPTDTPVLILGETGTGKERLARAIHQWSQRSEGPFVALNCAAVPASLLESALFGHVRGAFTGAARDRAGHFQVASGGTLLLDEVGELPTELQAKLLRVLQEGAVLPVGADREVPVDVRVLAATHVDLAEAVRQGRFREDLLYRLDVFPLRLPPLRERLEDLPRLCAALLEEQVARTGRRGLSVSPAALQRLARHRWPGNLRELANALERASILAAGQALGPEAFDHLPVAEPPPPRPPQLQGRPPELSTLREVERAHIEAVLAATGGRIYGEGGAAGILGLKPSTLQSRMKRLGVRR